VIHNDTGLVVLLASRSGVVNAAIADALVQLLPERGHRPGSAPS
jgi:hypothetical protein